MVKNTRIGKVVPFAAVILIPGGEWRAFEFVVHQYFLKALRIEASRKLKIGSLAGVRVYKFNVLDRQWLLAYELVEDHLPRFIYVGPHENFYRDLSRH